MVDSGQNVPQLPLQERVRVSVPDPHEAEQYQPDHPEMVYGDPDEQSFVIVLLPEHDPHEPKQVRVYVIVPLPHVAVQPPETHEPQYACVPEPEHAMESVADPAQPP